MFLKIGKQPERKKIALLEPGSVFKDYDVHLVQSLLEKLEDLDSLTLNYWLTKLSTSFVVWNCL